MMYKHVSNMLVTFLLLCVSISSFSQTPGNIRGRVTGENEQGLPGVSVMVMGTSRGTTTDAEGDRFAIE